MSGQFSGKLSENSVKRAVDFIHRRYAVKPGASFEAETGISADTFRKWRDGVAAPRWDHTLRMIAIFGPEFLACTCENAPRWLSEAARREASEKLKEQIERDQRKLKELTDL